MVGKRLSGSLILLASGLLTAAGCRDRAVGIDPRDAGPDSGAPDAAVDAALPDGGPPDAATGACRLQTSPTVVLSEGAPAFAYTLERLPGGQYLLAGGVGWSQDLGARLFALDGETLGITEWIGLNGTMAYSTFHQAHNYVVAADVEDNRTTLRWLTPPGSSEPFTELHTYLLCESCSPYFSRPVGGETRVAVAVEMYTYDQVMLILAELHWDGQITVIAASALPGAMPTVVPLAQGLLVLYLEDNQVMAVRYDWQGTPAFEARPVALPGAAPAFALSAASTPGLDGAYASVFARAEVPRDLVILRLDDEATVLASGVAQGATQYGYESAMAVSRGLVGVAWGETYGQGEVGAHFAAFAEADLSLAFGPSRISPAIQHSSSSYSVWATLAPHPDGFAEVWGSWQEDSYYGLYGMILRCEEPSVLPMP